MKGLVVDCSVTAVWLLEDEDDRVAIAALEAVDTTPISVPALWIYEVMNVLVVAERRKRLKAKKFNVLLEELAEIPIAIEHDVDPNRVIEIARRQKLSAYDAAYVELAQRKSYELCTLDQGMKKAARAEGVSLFEPA
ncbi:MAG: PIN domain-containing protein [Phycisphaeraceae bacterium]|nr:MAG: PIN domain-containing protein [Phycisphaeraceae bacterium]